MTDIEEIKKEIVERLQPLEPMKIILFGSYAYGEPNDDSDLDLCIVKKKVDSRISEKRHARKLLSDIRLPKDILIVDDDYFKSHTTAEWINTALYEARKYGEVLYE